MKTTYRKLFPLALAVGVFTSSASAVTITWVGVGNAGNAPDSTGYGAVGYDYRIAKNETTIGQYAEFLNAVAKTDTYALYSTGMTTSYINGISRSNSSGSYSYTVNPGSENKPITSTSWFDAARFCNWLHNGQPTGAQTALTTEDGAYLLNGATSGIITKNVGATVWIPSEDEWYKAAYYDPTKDGTGGYWLHANQSNSMTTNDIGVAGAANYYDANGYATYDGGPTSWGITDGGTYGANSDSFYGTADQGGNVHEWNDAVIAGLARGLRGGAWNYYENLLRSSFRDAYGPSSEDIGVGFRVASVPEPASMVLTIWFSGMLLTRRKR